MGMKMAKASREDMDAANEIAGILDNVSSGYYPSSDDAPDSDPTFFDENDRAHLRFLYDRLTSCMERAPGGLFRVTGGFHTIMHNDVVNPDDDVLELHPRIVAALAAAQPPAPADVRAAGPMDEQQRRAVEFALGMCAGHPAGEPHVAALESLLAVQPAPHADDLAVDRFAADMKAKLAAKRAAGRGGWDDPKQCHVATLARYLVEHVAKGDPVDVGNFAMMLHQRGADEHTLPAALHVYTHPRPATPKEGR